MELLSPAGNMEKLRAAVRYGADAVYFGGKDFGLRAKAVNFTLPDMETAIKFLHKENRKGYLTINAYARDSEMDRLAEYIKKAANIGVDAFIISDPGVFQLVRETVPEMELHISTQTNTTNLSAVKFWATLSASRAVLARELSREELERIVKNSPIEIECFVHGAVCISYSGRCLMSAYMTGRDANRGECTQPCRWNYNDPVDIQEATRPAQNMTLIEDKGTYLYNAKDICLIDRVGELAAMGVTSLKIEGRMKSAMYTAITTGVYRQAIDRAIKAPENYQTDPVWRELLNSVSNRHYTEGFYAGVPDKEAMNYETSAYIRNTDFLGIILEEKNLTVECKGKFLPGETLQIVKPDMDLLYITPASLTNQNGDAVPNSRAGDILTLQGTGITVPAGSILRRIIK